MGLLNYVRLGIMAINAEEERRKTDWFNRHKHLTNKEMIDKNLIDPIDIEWVDKLRNNG